MSYKIESGIPVPKMSKPMKYPLSEMKIGESFLVTDKKIANLRAYIYNISKKMGMKFKVMATEEGIRVWRVSDKKDK